MQCAVAKEVAKKRLPTAPDIAIRDDSESYKLLKRRDLKEYVICKSCLNLVPRYASQTVGSVAGITRSTATVIHVTLYIVTHVRYPHENL